jgi:SPX domain protein involved in polyphosphate accumulation
MERSFFWGRKEYMTNYMVPDTGAGEWRYERKFFVLELTLREIENLIRMHPSLFSEIFEERRINSIYFDSIDGKNYSDNVDGNSERMKIRVRWYGSLSNAKNPKLEIKIKNGEVGKKLVFPLEKFKLDGLSLERLQAIFSRSSLPPWLFEGLKSVRLASSNSYKRKYFLSADKKHRLTLDSDLCFFGVKNGGNLFVHRIVDKNNSILELKYKVGNEKKAAEITQDFPFRLSKSSKYVSGVDLMAL